jgi:hypothetical protein
MLCDRARREARAVDTDGGYADILAIPDSQRRSGSRIAVFLPNAPFRIARRFNREKTIEFVFADYEADCEFVS